MISTPSANSNSDATEYYLEHVWAKEVDTSKRSILLADSFAGQKTDFVKEQAAKYNTHIAIMHGGITPVAQPLDKVINKVFKGYLRDLYNLWMLKGSNVASRKDPKTGYPLPPSRQLLSTWVVEAWSKIPESLVQKAFTACGYYDHQDARQGVHALVASTAQIVQIVRDEIGDEV